MFFCEQNGRKLHLQVAGYAFPDPAQLGGALSPERLRQMAMASDFDAGLLLLNVEAADGDLSWHAVSPCLYEMEIPLFKNWLLAAAENSDMQPFIFFHPSLTVFRQPQGLDFIFNFELTPGKSCDKSGYKLSFNLGSEEIAELAHDIQEDKISLWSEV